MLRHLIFLAPIVVPSVVIATPVYFPGNGHYYELVPIQTTWAGAQADAATLTYSGVQGHLVTITSPTENEFLSTTFATGEAEYFAWIGGYEPGDDGVWLWGAGPENGVQFSNYATPTPPYNYANWQGIEPNDYAPGEDYAAMNLGDAFAGIGPGGWGDGPNPGPSDPILAYLVEYEPMVSGVGDPPPASLRVVSASPNPFSASTRIDFSHEGAGPAQIDIFDITGRRIRRLSGVEGPGAHSVTWNGRDDEGKRVSGGVYFYVVRSGSAKVSGKLLLVQ